MKRKLLLPHKYKAIGWIIFIPAVVLGIVSSFYDFHDLGIKVNVFAIQYDEIFGDQKIFTMVKTDITNTILGVLLIVGGLFVAFSREREEDEFIASLRLNSLLWAVLLNYLILLFCFLFIYGLSFLNVMAYNMFTTLVIFIARFHFLLYRNSKFKSDEKYFEGAESHA